MPILALIFLFCGGAHGLSWTELTPSEGSTPPVRMRAAGVYDPIRHRLIIIGGRTSGRELNDVWAFDLEDNAWTELTPTGGEAPPPDPPTMQSTMPTITSLSSGPAGRETSSRTTSGCFL